jgi:CSLREA domain-containing protein
MGGSKTFGAAILASLILAAPAGAATITVNTTEDRLNEGSCSLREAIATVDGTGHGFCSAASPSGNTIVLGATPIH